MEYVVYKLHFPAGVHFGAGALSDGVNTLPADTLFSALCQEAMAAQGPEGIEALVQAVRSSGLRLSDLFPFIGGELYLPKPLYPVKREENGDSIVKKSFKKLKYIPASQIGVYLRGDLNPLEQVDKLKQLGAFEMRTMAAGRSAEKIDTGDALPFSVGVYHFTEGNGLYFLAGFADSGLRETVENLLHALSFTGIGGKKSAGLGRFTVSRHEAPDDLTRRLAGSSAPCMSLSVCMAHAEQLEQVLHDAHYLLAKRSGFVDSASYAPEQRRKRDFYAFAAGSCFAARFDGDVYDVSNGGAHPVWSIAMQRRYGWRCETMAKGLQHYTITLITEGPLFIGSGKTIGKKEYIFDARRQLVHIPDLVKMNRFFLERRLEKAYEEYILNDKRDFAAWLRANQIDERQYRSWVRYSIDSGDAVFEQRGKKEIATFLKDAYGCPYVPGSSLKGALRTVLLAAEVLNQPDRFRRSRNAVRNAELRPGSKGNLREEKNQLEQGVFHTLNRNEKRKSDAVNDLLCGLRIGDSEPLRVDDLALCQKIDVTRDGVDKRLPILRECVRPETEIRFPLTIDPRYCTLTPQDIMEAANQFVRFYDKCFLEKFPTRDIRGGGNLYLGGGCGYVSKTVTYPLLGEQSVRRVSEIINATLSRTAAIQHKHGRDASRGVSPHMIKCTQYDGQLYEMGACSLEIQ